MPAALHPSAVPTARRATAYRQAGAEATWRLSRGQRADMPWAPWQVQVGMSRKSLLACVRLGRVARGSRAVRWSPRVQVGWWRVEDRGEAMPPSSAILPLALHSGPPYFRLWAGPTALLHIRTTTMTHCLRARRPRLPPGSGGRSQSGPTPARMPRPERQGGWRQRLDAAARSRTPPRHPERAAGPPVGRCERGPQAD